MSTPEEKSPCLKPEYEILITNDSPENVIVSTDGETWHNLRPGRFMRLYSDKLETPALRSTGAVNATKTETGKVLILELY